MRILHILNHIKETGNGIVNVAIDVACEQAKAGHEVAIASAGGGYETLLSRYGVTHFELDQTRKPLHLLKAAGRYRGIIAEFQPDIVHGHMMTGVVLAWFLRGSAKYKLVSHIHNVYQRSSVVMGLAERVISVSDAVATSMSKRGIPMGKMPVIKNRTLGSPRLPALDTCTPKALEHPAIVTVAGMNRRKGITELISAFEQVAKSSPKAHLYLVGDGPDRQMFETQAAASSVADRIHFEGFQKNPQAYMMAADVFVLASHRESFPLVLMEARQVGCPIVATRVDGVPEALDYGKAGVLVPPKNAIALADQIEMLLASPSEQDRLRRAAQQNIEELTVTTMVEKITTVYHQLLRSSPVEYP
ncbi:glycosyltransferase [Moorena sp. SIO3I6]|uniref:glycosyltransferase n=1 Tax=Moorena sp. SIO3I6 TaxID=2607831 RepID=UPI0013FCA56B|nr:glycosyltransferase [Moorena sp. SIO3I6]NEP22660.1 glycosyltransferase [Moorena sp. SIO3I6]